MEERVDASPEVRRHVGEVDALKGVAIVWVCLIHAKPLPESLFFEAVIDRAVPILLVLFGVTSKLWWDRATDRTPGQKATQFWWTRFTRLLPPVWIAVALWWFWVSLVASSPRPAWAWLVPHAFGYIPQVGTGWFVTLLVQLIVLLPLLCLVFDRIGPIAACCVGLSVSTWCHLNALDVVDWMQAALFDSAGVHGFFVFYYFWVFAPARLFPLFAGMALARNGARVSVRWTLVGGLIWALGLSATAAWFHEPFERNAWLAVLDVPLTITLLGLLRLGCPGALGSVLRWLGRASWSIYLGQLVVHNALDPNWSRWVGSSLEMRWAYFGSLLLGGVTWTLAQDAVVNSLQRTAARAQPPDRLASSVPSEGVPAASERR